MLVEQELWNIYTFYTLHGNPLAPEYLKNQQFMKMAKDCQMLSTKQGSGLTSADLSVIFAKEVLKKKNQNKTLAKRANPTLMTYSDFLNVLMILAPKIYPSADPKNVFQKLLLENILPLAARRAPKSVEEHMEEGSEVWTLLFETLEDGLKGIFDYYTDLSDRRRKKIAAQEVQDQVKLKGGHGQVQTTSKQKAKLLRETKSLMGYVEYIQFCQDFKIISLAQITTIQAGDIYLSSVEAHHGGDTAQDLNFEQFHQLLLRMAITAYTSCHPSISLHTKVKGLMLFLWKAVNTADASEKAVNGRGNRSLCDSSKSTKSGDLNLFGSSIFNVRMIEVWSNDNFVEYLVPVEEDMEDGETVLKRMLAGGFGAIDLGEGLESTVGDATSVVSSTVSTSALGKLLKERPHIAEMLFESLNEEIEE